MFDLVHTSKQCCKPVNTHAGERSNRNSTIVIWVHNAHCNCKQLLFDVVPQPTTLPDEQRTDDATGQPWMDCLTLGTPAETPKGRLSSLNVMLNYQSNSGSNSAWFLATQQFSGKEWGRGVACNYCLTVSSTLWLPNRYFCADDYIIVILFRPKPSMG